MPHTIAAGLPAIALGSTISAHARPGVSRLAAVAARSSTQRPPADRTRLDMAYRLMSFMANQDQTDPPVDFISRASGYTLFLAGGEAVLALGASQGSDLDLGAGAPMIAPVPIGSTFDADRGVLAWRPGPGVLGEHGLIFAHRCTYDRSVPAPASLINASTPLTVQCTDESGHTATRTIEVKTAPPRNLEEKTRRMTG